jgi:D-alanine-D-alanine ligase
MRIGITFDLKASISASPPGKGGDAASSSPLYQGGVGAVAHDDAEEEFDSPVTIEAIAQVIRGLGHEVEKLGDGRELLQRLLANPPDFVFNFAEGQGISRSREARVPAVLEMLGIPYSGSDPLALAATLDKDVAKRLVASAGGQVPKGIVVAPECSALQIANCKLQIEHWPVLVKPAWEGSSKGIRLRCLVEQPDQLVEVVEEVRRDQRQPVLIEEYVQGDEVTVGVIGNDPPAVLGMLQVTPRKPTAHFVYSLEIKRDYKRLVHYDIPPKLPPSTVAALEQSALASYRALGCRDVSRVDFRVRDGVPYFLEVNPLPGLNPDDSDLVILAKGMGWSYERLIRTIVEAALRRHGMSR